MGKPLSERDLVAWAIRLLEPFMEESREITAFVGAALDVGIEPCGSCNQRAATPGESSFLPRCDTCREEASV